MKVVGLITEYNPFHNGHRYHVEKAKEVAGADYAVAVMSGNFVQRGAPAIVDKYVRTEAALVGGCDAVVELPVRYATSSAEGFAMGAVALLSACGVEGVCFGSESGDVEVLEQLGELYDGEPSEYRERLSVHIKEGDVFPLARTKATLDYYRETCGYGAAEVERLGRILSSPNDILGIEYCKAIRRLGSSIKPYAVLRKGEGYHGLGTAGGMASASGIRSLYREGGMVEDWADVMPSDCATILRKTEGVRFPIWENDFSDMLHYALVEKWDRLEEHVDVSEDLADRIRGHIDAFTNFEEFAARLKTKQYTLTRIWRCLIHILLGLREEGAGLPTEGCIPYIRILGLNAQSSDLIKEIKRQAPPIPVLTKLSEGVRDLSGEQKKWLAEDLFAARLYNRAVYNRYGTVLKNEYRQGIVTFGEGAKYHP